MSARHALHATSLQPSLTARDLPTSIAWYTDVLGCTLERKIERDGKLVAAYITAGSARFLLNQDDGARGWDRKVGEGFSILFNIESGIDELAAGIKAAGGTLDLEPTDMAWGARLFRIRDPNGYKLAVAQPLRK